MRTSCSPVNGFSLFWLYTRSTLSSPNRLFDPLGDQSDPSEILTGAAAAAPTSAVCPYRSRLLNGDHTIEAPCDAITLKSAGFSATQWMPASDGVIAHSPP